MFMRISILIFLFEIKAGKITRRHNFTLVRDQSRLDVRKYSFSQRTMNAWNQLSNDCVHATSVLCVQEQNRQVSRKGGLHIE